MNENIITSTFAWGNAIHQQVYLEGCAAYNGAVAELARSGKYALPMENLVRREREARRAEAIALVMVDYFNAALDSFTLGDYLPLDMWEL